MPAASRQKSILQILSIAFVFFCGIAGAFVFVIFGLGSRVDAVKIVGTVLGAVGNRLPAVSTPYGKIDLKTERRNGGLQVKISCVDCRLRSTRLAAETLHLDKGVVDGFYKDKHFQGNVEADDVRVKIDTSWENHKAAGRFSLPESSISAIFKALVSIVPEAQQAIITGTIAGDGRFAWPEIDLLFEPKIVNFTVDGLVAQERYSKGNFNVTRKDTSGRTVTVITGEGTENWMPLSMMGNFIVPAVIAAEDGTFYSHSGYDVQGMLEASRRNREVKEIRRGGSTITQQLAKNLFLSGERTYSRKLRELLYAVELDRELGKKRILEIYLNVAEWGPGIYGIREAAKNYFNKVPTELLPEEAAWLASILNGPSRAFSRQFVANRPNLTRLTLVMRRMKGVPEKEIDAALTRQLRFAGTNPSESPVPALVDDTSDDNE